MGKNICVHCEQVCNLGDCGNAIAVDFPYGCSLDSMDKDVAFCSITCLINYLIIEQSKN